MRLLDGHVDLLALAEGERALLNIGARPLHRDREVVERQALRALEVEVLSELCLELQDRTSRPVQEERRDARVELHQVRLGLRPLGHQLAQLALHVECHRLLGEDHALAAACRADLGKDLAHAVGHVLAGHLDQPER